MAGAAARRRLLRPQLTGARQVRRGAREHHCHELNRKVLELAPCTVGASFQLPTKISTSEETTAARNRQGDQKVGTQIAAVFLGCPDDRESVAFACHLAQERRRHQADRHPPCAIGVVTHDGIANAACIVS
ncbi:hypothetical protein OsJ_11140 [Oryza sativa Japonica Group]|uniref:Uncharacterized protein n=1 Tax=Oryza sativa subsp. japonica TaxID=39947 RepID=A3AIR4_ORYSJ|nr:hypothetical protein OsJ_11140 [Oryza sativa Japonica Group]